MEHQPEIKCEADATDAMDATDISMQYYLFFDFECNGKFAWAGAFTVIGFPENPAFMRTGITVNEHIVLTFPPSPEEFNKLMQTFWFAPERNAAREYIAKNALSMNDDDYMANVIVAFVNKVRAKYPGIRFVTDNPTLHARYLDQIMDNFNRNGMSRISVAVDGSTLQRVIALDDVREGFLMASPHLKSIPQRPNCPLRREASKIPLHAPDGDVLRMAADFADLIVASISIPFGSTRPDEAQAEE